MGIGTVQHRLSGFKRPVNHWGFVQLGSARSAEFIGVAAVVAAVGEDDCSSGEALGCLLCSRYRDMFDLCLEVVKVP